MPRGRKPKYKGIQVAGRQALGVNTKPDVSSKAKENSEKKDLETEESLHVSTADQKLSGERIEDDVKLNQNDDQPSSADNNAVVLLPEDSGEDASSEVGGKNTNEYNGISSSNSKIPDGAMLSGNEDQSSSEDNTAVVLLSEDSGQDDDEDSDVLFVSDDEDSDVLFVSDDKDSEQDDDDSDVSSGEDEEDSDEDDGIFSSTSKKLLKELKVDHTKLRRCTLLHHARREFLFQDTSAGFYLIDGDSLLLEATQTKSWKYGQQLHFFYIIELYLLRLTKNVGRCEVVFFKEMERIWRDDNVLRTFRCALIKHLRVNCHLIVHCEWKDVFSEEWHSYLNLERPTFIFLHDGYNTSPIMEIIFKIQIYHCLAEKVDVAFTSNLHLTTSKLYAIYIQTSTQYVKHFEKEKHVYKNAWGKVMQFCSVGFLNISKTTSPFIDVENIRDQVFVGSVYFYWNDLRDKSKETEEKDYLCQWAHYFAVLSTSTLSERINIIHKCKSLTCHSSTPLDGERFKKFEECILRCLYGVTLFSCATSGFVADILDKNLASYVLKSLPLKCQPDLYSNAISKKYKELVDLAESKGIHLVSSSFSLQKNDDKSVISKLSKKGKRIKPTLKKPTLAAVSSRLSEEYAGEVMQTLNFVENIARFQKGCAGYIFDEKYHWQASKPVNDDIDLQSEKSLSKNPRIRNRELRQIQKFNNFMMMYGESLDKSIKPLVIAQAKNPQTVNRSNRPSGPTKFVQKKIKKGNECKKGKSAGDIIEENKKRRMLVDVEKVDRKWTFKRAEIEEIQDVTLAIKEVSQFIQKSLCNELHYEKPNIFFLKLQYEMWQKSCSDGNISFPVAADFVHAMHKMLHDEQYPVSDKLKIIMAKYFIKLGFEEAANLISETPTEGKTSTKSFVNIPYNVFQMQHMGHLMKRNERSDPDPRVADFIPDTWQRELLDAVDNNKSALVVAPTSSGKTFCSYYCMEKVLKEGDDGIVVYVSPTKALVNQVHASIYARYRKNMQPGQSLVGVFTRDYQHNAMACQILVTVPQCLELLLLSPKRQSWASRLSYVIFDEVHCIGGENGGEIWEHLITLIRCPFLALSATIGKPMDFHNWLSTVQLCKDNQESTAFKKGKDNVSRGNAAVKLVTYSERYSDLQKHIYIQESDELIEIHPCIFLDGHSLQKNGFPNGLHLSPKEAYELWLAGKSAFSNDVQVKDSLDTWCPSKYFGNKLSISKKDARDYEVTLKDYLAELIKGSLDRSNALITYFRSQFPQQDGNRGDKFVNIRGVEFDILQNFPALIEKLKKANKLPVLVFMNDRSGVESLIKQLKVHVENNLKKAMEKMKILLQRVDELEMAIKKNMKATRDVKKEKASEEEEKKEPDYLSNELQKCKLKIQRERDSCTFTSPGSVSVEFRDNVLMNVTVYQKELLEMGIGYHHAGCSLKFRRASEMLFRAKHAQVIAATGTLALGIHMPCKTVVFVGNDHYVDALSYRQMSGRSGRRGFDNIGNVVFYGVPVLKISKLIKADISSLEGSYPISSTLVLRIFLLTANLPNNDDAHSKAMVLLSHPFFTHQKPSFQNQLCHFFLFVTDFLIRQLLLDGNGVPIQFAGLVSHLHYHEPGIFVFVHLLRKGIFHEICKPSKKSQPTHHGYTCKNCSMSPIVGVMFDCKDCLFPYSLCNKCYSSHKNHRSGKEEHSRGSFVCINPNLKYTYSEKTLRLLVCILCHIFCKREIPYIRLKRSANGSFKLIKPATYGSKVLLYPLPPRSFNAIVSYNKTVSSNFANYLFVVNENIPKEGHIALPLSQKIWRTTGNSNPPSYLEESTAVVPFVQLSGCINKNVEENCLDREEIFRMLPTEVFMDFKSIPALDVDVPKNAYALDFFKHKSRRALEEDNMLKKGEIFDVLKDFMLLIKTIATALEELGPEDADDHVIWAFKHLSVVYRERFLSAFPDVRKF